MFQRLAHEWGPNRPRAKDDATPVYTPKQVADKVKVGQGIFAVKNLVPLSDVV